MHIVLRRAELAAQHIARLADVVVLIAVSFLFHFGYTLRFRLDDVSLSPVPPPLDFSSSKHRCQACQLRRSDQTAQFVFNVANAFISPSQSLLSVSVHSRPPSRQRTRPRACSSHTHDPPDDSVSTTSPTRSFSMSHFSAQNPS